MSQQSKQQVAVLAATGAVGQRFVQLLADHPWFELAEVTASDRSAGKRYAEACAWRLPGDIPAGARDLVLKETGGALESRIVFSALPGGVAAEIEPALAAAGHCVFSNTRDNRMVADVPLMIAEVNAAHAALVEEQRRRRGWPGCLVTNPNCSTIHMTLALAPLHRAFGLKRVLVTTLQALTGAGYPGVPSLDILDNVVPFVGGEEEKMASEPLKLLGELRDGVVEPAPIRISASCNRVNVRDGHTACVSLELARPASLAEVREALASFRAEPQALGLPSAPERPVIVRDEEDRPQPYLDRDAERGMASTVGRIRACPVLDYKFVVLGHNTIRGAAGCSILNAELLLAQGRLSTPGAVAGDGAIGVPVASARP